jgi:hypothetical protein
MSKQVNLWQRMSNDNRTKVVEWIMDYPVSGAKLQRALVNKNIWLDLTFQEADYLNDALGETIVYFNGIGGLFSEETEAAQ